jgi:iron-sulfur cluster insertion protein
MINITQAARQRVIDILYDENRQDVYLRVFVQGGGCSGFQYGFMLDYEKADDDFVVDADPFKIIIDVMSMQYLQGSEIDYKEELMSSSFVINNPNVSGSCGCGSSFSI